MKGWLVSKAGAGDRFTPPEDGWVQILSIGDWPNEEAGLVQACDEQALNRIMADFNEQAQADNWPGVLVDYDHFSHSKDKPSGAAGWADRLERRGDGLWAHVRFSESGEKAVRGGEYRLLSPVLTGFEQIAGNRKRPTKLYRLALTNDPNIKGLAPVSNRASEATQPQETTMDYKTELVKLLDLPESASDADITAAQTALAAEVEAANRAAKEAADAGAAGGDGGEGAGEADPEVTKQVAALNRRVVELEAELIERDVAQFDGLLGDNKAAKEALRELAAFNRGAVKALLTSIKPAVKPEAKPVVKPAVLAPLFNRRVQPLPQAAKPTDAPADEVDATKVRLRAQKILASNRSMGMTFSQAWEIARKEHKADPASVAVDRNDDEN